MGRHRRRSSSSSDSSGDGRRSGRRGGLIHGLISSIGNNGAQPGQMGQPYGVQGGYGNNQYGGGYNQGYPQPGVPGGYNQGFTQGPGGGPYAAPGGSPYAVPAQGANPYAAPTPGGYNSGFAGGYNNPGFAGQRGGQGFASAGGVPPGPPPGPTGGSYSAGFAQPDQQAAYSAPTGYGQSPGGAQGFAQPSGQRGFAQPSGSQGFAQAPGPQYAPSRQSGGAQYASSLKGGGPASRGASPGPPGADPAPPPYDANPQPPPSGFRIPLSNGDPFPQRQAGQAVSVDVDGHSPVYIGSAILERTVYPCKIVQSQNLAVRVGYGGGEHEHFGRYDLLPFDPAKMEWVPTSFGQLPPGRRAIEGGYEDGGEKLYHALANIRGVNVPGKTSLSLRGASIPLSGQEQHVEQYEILCWR